MKPRPSACLNCAWFYCSVLEWWTACNFKKYIKISISPFATSAFIRIIYESLRLLSPYRNSLFMRVERFEVFFGRMSCRQYVPCSTVQQQAGMPGCSQPVTACKTWEGDLGQAREQLLLKECQKQWSVCSLMKEEALPQFLWMAKWKNHL